MCPDDLCVRKDAQERVQRQDVAWVLKQPLLVRVIGTNETEVVGQAAVRGALVLGTKPLVVSREVEQSRERVRYERLAHQLQRLVNLVCGPQMSRLHRG